MKYLFFFVIAIVLLSFSCVEGQNATIEVKTSAQCETCKSIMEEALTFEKGVKSVVLNLETKILKVEYNTNKTTAEKIKVAITKAGYDADELPADSKAYSKLPACCQKP